MKNLETSNSAKNELKIAKLDGKFILYIEDDPFIIQIIKTFFERLQITIKCVSTLDKGLEILKNQTNTEIALIMTDGFLQDANKEQILEKIKETNSKIPVILATGDILTETEVKKQGFDGFCQKPFSIKKIIEEIKKVLA